MSSICRVESHGLHVDEDITGANGRGRPVMDQLDLAGCACEYNSFHGCSCVFAYVLVSLLDAPSLRAFGRDI